ncbi:MAG: DUF2971 domain-containing protein [Bacilli bacterium]|nr:DUF2971 domain-containing protein [Bacilli bacterium]
MNLLHKKQFGIDSLLNRYIFHNKPSYFNDPYDCVFGMSTNAFFRELLGQFTEVKGIGNVMQELQNNPKIFNLDDARLELEEIDIHPNVKKFVLFMLDTTEEIVVNQESFDINKGIIEFTRKVMGEPEMFADLLLPFIASKIDKDKLALDMKQMQDNIGEDNLIKLKVDPLNIRIEDFKEMSKFAGIAPGFKQAEEKINDSVGDFNKKIFNFIDDKFGIASFTTSFNDALMWSHYASSHTGICIEYDFSDYIDQIENSQMMLFPVNYSERRVTIDQNILDRIDLKNIEEQGRKDLFKLFFEGLCTKNTVWKYEDEWRSITLINDKKCMNSRKINAYNISAVYFGNKMNDDVKQILTRFIEQDENLRKIKLYEMVNDISEYKINRLPFSRR